MTSMVTPLAVFICENGGRTAVSELSETLRQGLCLGETQLIMDPDEFQAATVLQLHSSLAPVRVGEAKENLSYAGVYQCMAESLVG